MNYKGAIFSFNPTWINLPFYYLSDGHNNGKETLVTDIFVINYFQKGMILKDDGFLGLKVVTRNNKKTYSLATEDQKFRTTVGFDKITVEILFTVYTDIFIRK